MSRYRPPRPKSSPYITPEGLFMLQKESVQLWKKRAGVTAAVTAAAAEGDRSENAEYIYRKKQLREIDRRIRYLQKRLPDLKVVDSVADETKVYFGAKITLEKVDLNQQDETIVYYKIVGTDEIDSDSAKGYISVDSPLSRALIAKQVDDEIMIKIGEETRCYRINKIEYG